MKKKTIDEIMQSYTKLDNQFESLLSDAVLSTQWKWLSAEEKLLQLLANNSKKYLEIRVPFQAGGVERFFKLEVYNDCLRVEDITEEEVTQAERAVILQFFKTLFENEK